MIEYIQETLKELTQEGTFAVQKFAPCQGLDLEVSGIGSVTLPITQSMGKKLCEHAEKAPFGYRDQTLYDEKVRDTWQIHKTRLTLKEKVWTPFLKQQLVEIQKELGLGEGEGLRAELDKLLIYEPGQFFRPHRDSERDDDMVGTLSVVLPSSYQGGRLVLKHDGEVKRFAASERGKQDLSLIAFYGDCEHEVEPVLEGYRVVLSFNLLATPSKKKPKIPDKILEKLNKQLHAHFNRKVLLSKYSKNEARPDRFIYLLDHEYSEKSLAAGAFKGADRIRVQALLDVADQLELDHAWGLVDIHESWSCEFDGYSYDGFRRLNYSREKKDRDPEDYQLQELIDSNIQAKIIRDGEGKVVESVLETVSDYEYCQTRDSNELKPARSEHEGWMGNYGNTVDRWYHRAGLFLFPRSRRFILKAKFSPTWGMEEILRIQKKDVDAGRALIEEFLPHWREAAWKTENHAFAGTTLEVAVAADDQALAEQLLHALNLSQFDEKASPAFSALVVTYGAEFAFSLLAAWIEKDRYGVGIKWAERCLIPLSQHLKMSKAGINVGLRLTKLLWDLVSKKLLQEFESFQDGVIGRTEFTNTDTLIIAILHSDHALRGAEKNQFAENVMDFVGTQFPVLEQVRLLTSISVYEAEKGINFDSETLQKSCMIKLQKIVSKPPRAEDNWSIYFSRHCKCELCSKFEGFLISPKLQVFEWPLAKEKRQHIHNIIDINKLPLTHVTQRKGSPHKLLLTKTKDLFMREASYRIKIENAMDVLKSQASTKKSACV